MIPNDVHPQIQAFLRQAAEAGLPPIQALDPTAARAQFEEAMRARREAFPPPAVAAVEERTVPGPAGPVPVRVYRGAEDEDAPDAPDTPDTPDASSRRRQRRPVLVWFHGGGHVIGSLDTHDTMARNLCREAGCTVVSVDYRMGPEHPFPAAVDDCAAVVRRLAAHPDELGADPERIAVGGDSAGGNLAAVAALLAREEGGPPLRYQLLVYPVTDYRCRSGSYERYARGYGTLEAESMRWFQRHYLGGPRARAAEAKTEAEVAARAEDWRASPLLAPDHANLPPALVITAECDVLHDEGAAYAARLAACGTPCEHVEFPGMIHGFFGLLGIADAAGEAHARAARALREAFADRG